MAFLFGEAGMISRFLLHHVRGRYPYQWLPTSRDTITR
jgi:hypothetical protein